VKEPPWQLILGLCVCGGSTQAYFLCKLNLGSVRTVTRFGGHSVLLVLAMRLGYASVDGFADRGLELVKRETGTCLS
jgi:hypothetical protein